MLTRALSPRQRMRDAARRLALPLAYMRAVVTPVAAVYVCCYAEVIRAPRRGGRDGGAAL